MPNSPQQSDPMFGEIVRKLDEIEAAEHVRILYAAESGSRAWGFASKDSDYDVRFIYVRRQSDYLRLNPVRDVIEWQLDEVLDINGWDVSKALRLLHASNPTLFEWCQSPIVYRRLPAWEPIAQITSDCFNARTRLRITCTWPRIRTKSICRAMRSSARNTFIRFGPCWPASGCFRREPRRRSNFKGLQTASFLPSFSPQWTSCSGARETTSWRPRRGSSR